MVCWSSMDVWHLQILWLIFLVIAHVMLLSLARVLDFPEKELTETPIFVCEET